MYFMHFRYDRTDNSFRQIQDIQFVAAMGPPGGGRNPITPRYLRHYHVLSVTDFDDSSLNTVFGTIMSWWARKTHLATDVCIMLVNFRFLSSQEILSI